MVGAPPHSLFLRVGLDASHVPRIRRGHGSGHPARVLDTRGKGADVMDERNWPQKCNPGEGCFECPYSDCIRGGKISPTKWEVMARKCDPLCRPKKTKKDSGNCYFPKTERGQAQQEGSAQSNHSIDLSKDTSYDLLNWIHYKF